MALSAAKSLLLKLDPVLARIPAFELERWPQLLMLNTTDHCNLRCAWCPNRFLTRPKGRMDLDFSLDLIERYARGGGGVVQFSAFGEPLLDPHLFTRIAAARRPEIRRRLCFSNAQLLNESNRTPLVESGLTYLNLSLNEFTPERYEAIMGQPFDRAFGNVLALIDLNTRRGLPIEIKVDIKSSLSREELLKSSAYADLAKRGVSISFRSMNTAELTWGGIRNPAYYEALGAFNATYGLHPHTDTCQVPCAYIWFAMVVGTNGEVVLCCLDMEHRKILGNLKTQGIEEVWRGKKAQGLRRMALARPEGVAVEPCKGCTMCRTLSRFNSVQLFRFMRQHGGL